METPEWGSKRQEAKKRYIQVEEAGKGEEDAWQWSQKRYRRRGKR